MCGASPGPPLNSPDAWGILHHGGSLRGTLNPMNQLWRSMAAPRTLAASCATFVACSATGQRPSAASDAPVAGDASIDGGHFDAEPAEAMTDVTGVPDDGRHADGQDFSVPDGSQGGLSSALREGPCEIWTKIPWSATTPPAESVEGLWAVGLWERNSATLQRSALMQYTSGAWQMTPLGGSARTIEALGSVVLVSDDALVLSRRSGASWIESVRLPRMPVRRSQLPTSGAPIRSFWSLSSFRAPRGRSIATTARHGPLYRHALRSGSFGATEPLSTRPTEQA